jgi:type IV secretion system protein VirB11
MPELEEELSSVKSRAKEKLKRDLGPVLLEALNDPKTAEIMANADGRLWQERLGERMRCIGTMRPSQADAIIKTVAGYHGKEVTRLKPTLEGELPLDGSRFAGQLPPVVRAPTFAIRKRAIAIFTLAQYVVAGIMTAAQCSIIARAIAEHRNKLDRLLQVRKTTLCAIIVAMVCAIHRNAFSSSRTLAKFNAGGKLRQYHTSIDVTMACCQNHAAHAPGPDSGWRSARSGARSIGAGTTPGMRRGGTLHASSAMAGLTSSPC